MPRIQVYLPEDLYVAFKERGLPASELFQKAVRKELQRIELIEIGEEQVAALRAELGESSPVDKAWANDIVDRVARHFEQAAS